MSDVGAGKIKIAPDLTVSARGDILECDGQSKPGSKPGQNPDTVNTKPGEPVGLTEKLQPQGKPMIERTVPQVLSAIAVRSSRLENVERSDHSEGIGPPSGQAAPEQTTPEQTTNYEAIFQVCNDDVPTLQPQRCLRCVRLYELAFPCRFLA